MQPSQVLQLLVPRLDEAHERVEQAKEEAKFEANKARREHNRTSNHQSEPSFVIIGHGSLMVH